MFGPIAVTGSRDHTLLVWDLTTGTLLGDLVGAENRVTSCDLQVLVDEAAEPI